jgi:hypothetical protein
MKSKKSRKSRKSKKKNKTHLPINMLGGFIRSGVPQYSYYCGSNPLYDNAPYNVLNQCNGMCATANEPSQYNLAGGCSKHSHNSSRSSRKSLIYSKYL